MEGRHRHEQSFALVCDTVAAVIAAGVLQGEPDDVGLMLWAGVMGVATQELGGHIDADRSDLLVQQVTVSLVAANLGPNG